MRIADSIVQYIRALLPLAQAQDDSAPPQLTSPATELLRELQLPEGLLDDVILEADEIRPIVDAIRSKSRCALLVFGCGNDSLFWEFVNIRGATAFLEDNAYWADITRAQLKHSSVHVVEYETRLSEWPDLLGDANRLSMTLPDEIRAACWDVVLVDGPEGFNDECPGRMKSIFAASQLVAPGGHVFVHDCERPAEAAYASTYLTSGRLALERRGRATLRGYAF